MISGSRLTSGGNDESCSQLHNKERKWSNSVKVKRFSFSTELQQEEHYCWRADFKRAG